MRGCIHSGQKCSLLLAAFSQNTHILGEGIRFAFKEATACPAGK
jgi:hypothetical protein